MGRKQNTYHHGNLREALIETAWAKIQDAGVDKLSLRGCARDIGVDAAAIYQHFRSKDAILEEIARIGFTQLAEAMENDEHQARPDARAQLIAVGRSYVIFAKSNPQLFALMFKIAGQAQSGATIGCSKKGRNAYQILLEAWERFRGINENDVVSPIALWSAVHGISELLNQGLGPKDEAQIEMIIREICESMIDGRNARC